jgi:ferredoxin
MSDEQLQRYDARAWRSALDALSSEMHPVDRDATRIWFQFFPLPLADAIATEANLPELSRRLRLVGHYRLATQVDTSHWFLYGHRFWPPVKAAVVAWSDSPSSAEADLPLTVRAIVGQAARSADVARPLLTGISLIGLMTLRQVGIDQFRRGSGDAVAAPPPARTPEQIVSARQKDDGQGWLGFLRGPKTQFTVCFDERRPDGSFPLINQQDLTMAAATDTRDYLSGPRPSREGPIPTDCRSASCGTCWVGILGGAEKLSDVDELEHRRLREFGYLSTAESKPIIRLACMAKASGHITIAIPPWNGIIGHANLGSS